MRERKNGEKLRDSTCSEYEDEKNRERGERRKMNKNMCSV